MTNKPNTDLKRLSKIDKKIEQIEVRENDLHIRSAGGPCFDGTSVTIENSEDRFSAGSDHFTVRPCYLGHGGMDRLGWRPRSVFILQKI